MKRIVRLTESDLTRIVRRVMNEQTLNPVATLNLGDLGVVKFEFKGKAEGTTNVGGKQVKVTVLKLQGKGAPSSRFPKSIVDVSVNCNTGAITIMKDKRTLIQNSYDVDAAKKAFENVKTQYCKA